MTTVVTTRRRALAFVGAALLLAWGLWSRRAADDHPHEVLGRRVGVTSPDPPPFRGAGRFEAVGSGPIQPLPPTPAFPLPADRHTAEPPPEYLCFATTKMAASIRRLGELLERTPPGAAGALQLEQALRESLSIWEEQTLPGDAPGWVHADGCPALEDPAPAALRVLEAHRQSSHPDVGG